MNDTAPPSGTDPVDGPPGSGARDTARLLAVMEASLRIDRRFQFFLWTQGVLQSFLPHETLFCAAGDLERGAWLADTLSTEVVDAAPAQWERAVLEAALEQWLARGREPLCWDARMQALHPDAPLTCLARRHRLGEMLAHGTRDWRGDNGSFVLLARLPGTPGPRMRDLLRLLQPCLHFALLRYLAAPREDAPPSRRPLPLMSERELQVLAGVREGRTNAEIARVLGLSALTVKNHVQRILRKLGAANRAQAVARCQALGLSGDRDRPARRDDHPDGWSRPALPSLPDGSAPGRRTSSIGPGPCR